MTFLYYPHLSEMYHHLTYVVYYMPHTPGIVLRNIIHNRYIHMLYALEVFCFMPSGYMQHVYISSISMNES